MNGYCRIQWLQTPQNLRGFPNKREILFQDIFYDNSGITPVIKVIIFLSFLQVHHHPDDADNVQRVCPHQLRLLRRVALHHNVSCWSSLFQVKKSLNTHMSY